jgi:predicted Zn-dependent protease
MSQAQLAQIGLIVGSILAGPQATQAYGSLAELGAGLLFTRYSRQQETQADLLGTAYMTEAAFNPRGAENMLLALQRLQRGETSALERYFIDHPDPRKRVGDVRKEIAALQVRNPSIGTSALQRDPFVRKLANMITGRSTMQTTVRGNTIYQRKTGIIATAPQGWIATTEPGKLFVMVPRGGRGEGFIAQDLPTQRLPNYQNVQVAIRSQLQNMGLRYVTSGQAESATGERFNVDLWQGRTSRGSVAVESTQFIAGESAIVFLEVGPATRRRTDLVSIVRTMRFDRDRARSAEPPRIRVERARRGDTWQDIARRATGNPAHAETVAKINGFDFPSTPPPDLLLKLPEDVIEEV